MQSSRRSSSKQFEFKIRMENSFKTAVQRAIDMRRHYFEERYSSITMAQCRTVLETDLGLEKGALSCHKREVSRLIDRSLDNSTCQSPAYGPTGIDDLLPDVLELVFRHLDHEGLFTVGQACRARGNQGIYIYTRLIGTARIGFNCLLNMCTFGNFHTFLPEP